MGLCDIERPRFGTQDSVAVGQQPGRVESAVLVRLLWLNDVWQYYWPHAHWTSNQTPTATSNT